MVLFLNGPTLPKGLGATVANPNEPDIAHEPKLNGRGVAAPAN